MAKEYLKGCRNLRLFPITTVDTESSAPVYATTGTRIEKVQSFGFDDDVTDVKVGGDDETDQEELLNGIKVTIEVAQIPIEYLPMFISGTYDDTTKSFNRDESIKKPYVGVTVVSPVGGDIGGFRGFRLYKCKVLTCSRTLKSSSNEAIKIELLAVKPLKGEFFREQKMNIENDVFVTDISTAVAAPASV